jgi:hypothetical protein
MTKFRTGATLAALMIAVAAVVGLDRYGKAIDDDPWKEFHPVSAAASSAPMPEWMKAEIIDPSRAIYEITKPDGVFRLTTPHALTYDDLNAIVAAMCKASTCEVTAYQNDAPATKVAK